jgi:hypothetical protein
MAHQVDLEKVIKQMRQSGIDSGASPEAVKAFCEDQFSRYEQLLDQAEKNGEKSNQHLLKQFTFWSSLLDAINKFGKLTVKQEAMVCRCMRRDVNAPLPEIGSRILIDGEVVSAKGFVADNGDMSVCLSVFDEYSREARVNIWAGTKIFENLGIDAYQDHNGEPIISDYPKHIRIMGTIDWREPGVYKVKRPVIVKE